MTVLDYLVPAALTVLGYLIWRLRLGALAKRGEESLAEPGPRESDAPAEAASVAPVSIIIPARDEAHNLPALLTSLQNLDPAPREIIVVDDHSTDGTGDIARAAGVRVISPPTLPADWNGKPWACHAGASVAEGEFLLFTDADTLHAPDSLGRAMARMHARGAGLLSVVPTHIVHAGWERLQGVFQLLLLIATRAGGAPARSRRRHERRFSIGQYLLFRRDAYDALGGHEPVKQRIAEDLAFARMIDDAGLGFALLFSPGLMRVRMYPEGFGAFVRGWRRNFREGLSAAGLGGVVEMIAVIGWLLGAPLFCLQAGLGGHQAALAAGAGVYLATAFEVARWQRAQGPFPRWSGLFYPLFTVVFVAVTLLSLIDRGRGATVMWRGRPAVPGGESSR